jgi:hypothetical protein
MAVLFGRGGPVARPTLRRTIVAHFRRRIPSALQGCVHDHQGVAMEGALKQQEIFADDGFFWPIPDMALKMRVEHNRLTQLGWVYDGFGGYTKQKMAQAMQRLLDERRASRHLSSN